jgi:hypothetical protein
MLTMGGLCPLSLRSTPRRKAKRIEEVTLTKSFSQKHKPLSLQFNSTQD